MKRGEKEEFETRSACWALIVGVGLDKRRWKKGVGHSRGTKRNLTPAGHAGWEISKAIPRHAQIPTSESGMDHQYKNQGRTQPGTAAVVHDPTKVTERVSHAINRGREWPARQASTSHGRFHWFRARSSCQSLH